MNNGLLDTLNKIIPLFEKMMEYTNKYEASSYMKTIEIAMNKKYNAFSICLVFDLMLSEFLNNCRISLVDLVLERDKDAVDCVAISKDILDKLRNSGYYDLKETAYKKMQTFLDETYRKGTKIDTYFEKGEKLYQIIESHFSTIDRMELHQFIKGKETNEKPLYIKDINCFRNMNDAVQVMSSIPVNFIALVGIKDDTSNEYGYFAYLVKNGQSLYALSDINRADGKGGVFTRQRDVYRDLMPYVQLNEFKYVWFWTDALGVTHPLNTDKYHIVVNDRNWNIFTLNELEDDEILMQYFMFDYVNNLFFREKHEVKELSYTTQNIALTYKGKVVNKKQLPTIYNKLNSTEIELPDLISLFDEVGQELYKNYIDDSIRWNNAKKTGRSTFFLKECSERSWEVKLQAIESIRNKLKSKPLDVIFFEYDKDQIMKVSGTTEQLSKTWHERLWGISSHFFGTGKQYQEYSRSLLKENFRKMIDLEYENIIRETKAPQCVRFINYLFSTKFKELIIEKCLLDALTVKRFSTIEERAYTKSQYGVNRSWEETGDNIWNIGLSWIQRDENKGCILTGAKNCSYKIGMRLRNLKEMECVWDFLNEENVPDYLKIYSHKINVNGLKFDNIRIYLIFHCGCDSLFWISKKGLKEFCKKHDLDYAEALKMIVKNNDE